MWNLITVITHPLVAYLVYLWHGDVFASLIGLVFGLSTWILLQTRN